MNLANITLKGIDANQARSVISALEVLPIETIQGGNFPLIEAYWNFPDSSISLHLVGTKDELKEIQFNAPKNSKILKRTEYELGFNYDNQNYWLKKEIKGACYP